MRLAPFALQAAMCADGFGKSHQSHRFPGAAKGPVAQEYRSIWPKFVAKALDKELQLARALHKYLDVDTNKASIKLFDIR